MNYFLVKRFLDVVGASVGLILFSPIFLLVALFIKLNSRGPMFADIPSRVGAGGKTFKMYKFRSMIVNAHDVLRKDPKYKQLYEQYKKSNFKVSTDQDPRITKVGRFIRKTSLDELPQFINILKGDMSLVGPRAFHGDELEEQQQRYPETRKLVVELLGVKPGLTGPWQVSGRSSVDFPERVKLDADYAKSNSVINDIKIILKTIPAV
ncbi:MAG: multidrug MFS transporter, partial [Candidatus Woykebacteria bacterium RIFCSPLOWO2_01_FULL_41_12]